MKYSIPFLLLAIGCAAVPAKRRTQPPLPPMPPGFVARAASPAPRANVVFTPASVGFTTNAVGISGPFSETNENGGITVTYLVYGTQLASNELHLQQSGEPAFNSPVDGAIWYCYPYEQPVVAMFNANFFTTSYFRSLNVPCDIQPAIAAARVATLSNATPPKLAKAHARWRVKLKGRAYKIGTELPAHTNGVRRFTLETVK